MARQLIAELEKSPSEAVTLKGWIRRIRETIGLTECRFSATVAD